MNNLSEGKKRSHVGKEQKGELQEAACQLGVRMSQPNSNIQIISMKKCLNESLGWRFLVVFAQVLLS